MTTTKKSRIAPPMDASAWIGAANETPAVVVGTIEPKTAAVTPAAPAPTPKPAKAAKKAPAAQKQAVDASDTTFALQISAAYSWLDGNPLVPKTFNIRFNEQQRMMLDVARVVSPDEKSVHEIALKAIMADVHRRLRAAGIDPDRKREES